MSSAGLEIKTLDVGCGTSKEPGSVGMDRVASVRPDVLHDIDSFPWPFEDGSFDRVLLKHVIEHVSDVVKIMEEIHRVGKNGAEVLIITPHYSSSNSWTDPTHKQHLGFYTFEFFCGGEGRIGFYTDVRFEIVSKRLDFFGRYRRLGIEWLANRMPRSWEKYLCHIFPARNMTIQMRVIK